MGRIVHDAIVVTAHSDQDIDRARAMAISLGLTASDVCASPSNGYRTFFICPDGSKEGWPDSDAHDIRRAEWMAWAHANERTVFIQWAAVRYGHDLETPPQVTGGTVL